MKPNKQEDHKKIVVVWIFLRTPTKQAYNCRYVNGRSNHNVSYAVEFEVLCMLIRNQNNAISFVAELLVGSPMSHDFRQELFNFFFYSKIHTGS